jgi:DNA-binding response OmpR family regulator
MATILLVEDDNNLREIYEARLKAEGYDIASAHDGEEALVVAKEKKPNLIIADVMMPKISGFEMLDILRNTAGLQDVKIIMLTALGQVEDQQKATSLGADRYLVKSQVTLEDIVNAARELLETPDGDEQPTPSDAAVPTPPVSEPQPVQTAPVANDPSTSLASTPLTPTAPTPVAATTLVTPEPPTENATPSTTAVDDKLIDDAATSLSGDTTAADSASSTDKSSATPVTPAPDTSMASPAVTEPTPTAENATSQTIEPTPVSASLSSPITTQPTEDASPLEVSKDLEEKLKEDSAEVEHSNDPVLPSPSATTDATMGAEPSSSDPVPIAPPTEQSSDYLSATEGPQIESTPGSSMKVIQPIPSSQPNINDLLEKESLTEAANPLATDMNPPESADTNPDQPQVVAPSNPVAPSDAPATNDVAL